MDLRAEGARMLMCSMMVPFFTVFLGLALLYLGQTHAAAPVVSNVRAVQRPGTGLVDIEYNLMDPDGNAPLAVTFQVSADGGVKWTAPVFTFQGAVGVGVVPGDNRMIVWNAGVDWPGQFNNNCRVRVCADDRNGVAPEGMALIPAGNFTMGDSFSEGDSDERPTHGVHVSGFYMDRHEVTKALWDEVHVWAVAHGYSFDNAGLGKAANHPVHTVSWSDAVKWCNARSEREGKVPAYYTDAGLTARYRSGQVAVYVDWSRGYRLPTEAEWEKAARGGAAGHRFPWSDSDTIQHTRADYYSSSSYAYDTSTTRGYHPVFNDGVSPYTGPVGYFAPNGYGLYDMAGNVWEWCWDWWGSGWSGTSSARQADTRGPASGSSRVVRGGSGGSAAWFSRAALRRYYEPGFRFGYLGFRSVLPLGQ